MSRLRHAALLLALAPGCYLAHGLTDPRGGPDGGALSDVRRDTPVVSLRDTPAPLGCPSVRARATCLEAFGMPVERPFELPVQFDGCGCCPMGQCDVAVDVAARTLQLNTRLCPDVCDCDECNTPVGSCSVPALPRSAAGPWTVAVNGVTAFAISLLDMPIDPPAQACATYADVDACGAEPHFGELAPLGCVEHGLVFGRDTLVLRDFCSRCGSLDSTCTTSVTPRFTDDLPPGGDILFDARRYDTSCDVDCPSVCNDHTRTCVLPALEPGGFYRVFVDGRVVTTFTQGEPSVSFCLMP